MTTKTKTLALNGPPAAGIFSDMTVDGPEIGTLVMVVDRAKNLPNRKTIGKQDPYCAARLGKEAKKTATDIRGGQTPKWDQELRFTVHDSPDYYQVKVSVFNDDKRTELIGEAWIDLRGIVVPGGGQSDQWHQLNYKGKYAGEVRIEITYYDSRPKPEKPAVKAKPQTQAQPDQDPAASVPVPGPIAGPRGVPKRRPLPSDPLTGKPPPAPAVPDQTDTPPSRPQPNPVPVQQPPPQPDYGQPDYGQPQPQVPPQAPPHAQPPAQPAQYYPSPDPSRDAATPRRSDQQIQYWTPDRADPYAVQQDPVYTPIYQPPRRNSYDPSLEEDRPPPPPAHRTRAGSNSAIGPGFQATPATMRQDVLRNEAHRNSIDSANYPGRPTYKSSFDPGPGSQYSHADPMRHPSYDPGYEPHHRTMQATVEDVPESPEAMNDPRRVSANRWPVPTSQPQPQPQPSQFDTSYDLAASPAPLSLPSRSNTELGRFSQDSRYQGANSHSPGPEFPSRSNTELSRFSHESRYQAANGHSPGPEFPRRESPEYAPAYGRHSEPVLATTPHSEQLALTYRGELDDTSTGYSAPPVPASLVPGIDPNIAQDISERINQDRRQQTMQQAVQQAPAPPVRSYTSQALVETSPSRGRPIEPRYSHDAPPAAYPAPSHARAITYTNGPSTSSVNVVIKSRAYSPNPPRDPSPNPRSQHTIRRKSVSPRPPLDSERSMSMPFSPDSYEALNPNASVVVRQDTPAARADYREDTGKIITHDGREVDPSDHLPMESWAPEPEPKQPQQQQSSASSSRPAPSGRRPLRVAGRPQSMQPVSSGVSFSSSPDHVTNAPPQSSAARTRLQKKAPYRQSTSAIVPIMSGANGPGSSPRPTSSGNTGPHDDFTPPRQISRASTFDYAAGASSGGGDNYSSHRGGGGTDVYGTSPGSLRYGHSPGQHGHSPGHGHSYSYSTSPGNSHGMGYQSHHQHSRSAGASPGGPGNGPPVPAKIPLALPSPADVNGGGSNTNNMSGALQLHSSSVARRQGQGMDDYDDYGYSSSNGGLGIDNHGGGGGGGGGTLSLEEELRQIDIGTGRSSRRNQQASQGYGRGPNGYGSVGYGKSLVQVDV
ncbi:hypothetical protein VTJ49DRAFT_3871 [Mycothermus thermophilus]|uniref:C2 domain-containing protein n=1 Tax=Humicola insolens TaxID=85995 RepID=A0ABR3VQM1_HUMIN